MGTARQKCLWWMAQGEQQCYFLNDFQKDPCLLLS